VKEMHDIGIDAVLLIYSTKFEVARWIARHCWYRLGSEGVGWGPYQDYSEFQGGDLQLLQSPGTS
jgi:hypothetical protein